MADARRVALLARPGGACERMRAALVEAGARIVYEADPTRSEPATLAAARAEVVLVVLDAATEDALDRFADELADPTIEVIFEEAEIALTREGWDAARWVRHLAAKLHRHDDVLPPRRQAEAMAVAADADAASALAEAAAETERGLEFTTIELVEAERDEERQPVAGDVAEDLSFAATELEPPPLPPAEGDSSEESDRFRRDLADLERRIASMELVDDRPAASESRQARGAVLVLAGIGGPDAVRQLLGALPEGFARPVLVQQRLDGGRYDRLVAQMQRATTLPVKLAEPGAQASPGEIYILPAELGVVAGDAGLSFVDGPGDVFAALPANDSAVLLLSGADPAVVDTVMNQSWSGALVAGQAPEGCYDAAATNALIARGGEAGQPADLARRLVGRWPT